MKKTILNKKKNNFKSNSNIFRKYNKKIKKTHTPTWDLVPPDT